MTALKIAGVVLAAIWMCQAIVFLVTYRRQRRNA
jgi:hypothetical protein